MIQFLAALVISHQDDLKKRMNRIMATWENGCFEKIDDHSVHTIPNHHPPKVDVLPFKYVPQLAATTFVFPSVFKLAISVNDSSCNNLFFYLILSSFLSWHLILPCE